MRAIAIVGNKAYVGVGSRLTILDITNKLHPEVLGMTDPFPDLVENVVVSGNYAYIAATTAGLRIIDISDASHPVQIGVALGPGLAYGIAIAGTNLFIADPSKGMLWLFDASNPANPVKVWTIKDYYSPLDILVEDNILYLAAGNLEIFDLTNISQPSLLSSVSFDVNSGDILYSIAKNGDYLYAYTRNAGLQIIDVSNPLAPVKKGLFSLGNGYDSYNDIEVINDYAFILHYTGFYVVDIRNPDAPLQAGYLKIPSIPARLTLSQGTAFVADMDSLRFIDITNPTHTLEIGSYEPGGIGGYISLIDHYAYLSGFGDFIDICDVSDPFHPNMIGRDYSFHWNEIKPYSANIAYAYGWRGNIGIVDISNPANPLILSQLTASPISDLTIAGHYLYAIDMPNSKLLIYDVTYPETPALISQLQLTYNPQKMILNGNYAYISNIYGIFIVDIADPDHPAIINNIPHQGSSSIAASGSNLLVADGPNGYSIYDLSQPSNPTIIGTFITPGNVHDIVVQNGLAFIADNSDVVIVDLSNITNPAIIATHPILTGNFIIPTGAFQIVLSKNMMYVTTVGDGYQIFQVGPIWQANLPIISR